MVLPLCMPECCGKTFREGLKQPSPNYTGKQKLRKIRLVPAFTIQALQRNTRVAPPKKSDVYDPRPLKPTLFRRCYEKGDIPISIEFSSGGKKLRWKVPIERLDFHHYLPMFLDGLTECEYPYDFIVQTGVRDLVSKAPHKILPVVPQLIMPIKRALDTKNKAVLCLTMKCLQSIVKGSDRVGEALVPYYRQILPIFNLFKGHNRNIGSDIDHSASSGENIADAIEQTLNLLERYGGPDAFINIKYMIPTYESCVLN